MHIISGDLWAGAEAQTFTLLRRLNTCVRLKVVVFNEGELTKRLRSESVDVLVLPETQMSSLQLFWKLLQQIAVFNPQILHSHRQKENVLSAFANLLCRCVGRGAQSVRTAHGAPEFAPKGKQRIQVWLDQFVGRRLQQAVIAVSEELSAKLAVYFPGSKIHFIRNGVDVPHLLSFAKAADLGAAQANFHIGLIGRLEPVKRADLFIQTAEIILRQHSEIHTWHFHIIGDGKLKDALRGQVQNLGLDEYITFHGHRNDIPSCIRALNLVVMCSDHEGTPMTALETLALGTVLVAHNTGGLSELLESYPQLLVDSHTPEGYASAVVAACIKPEIARVQLDARYTAEQNAANTLALYNQLLAGRDHE